MASIDYKDLIMDLEDRAFFHCRSILYHELSFVYIDEEEVRRVDLCEKLYMLSHGIKMCPEEKKDNWYSEYMHALKYYLTHYYSRDPGTIADQCKKRALEIISGSEDSISVKALETVFAIFLGLEREDSNNEQNNSITLFSSISDEKLLNEIKDTPLTYHVRCKKTLGAKTKEEEMKAEWKQAFYIHNVIILCRLLQAQGEFEEVE